MNSLILKMGLGCWQIGGHQQLNGVNNGWQPMEKSKRVALIERAIELGFSFFDTASGYGNGESEEILGLGISNSKKRDRVKICTKISIATLDENGGFNWQSFEKSIQRSLERLGVDKVDLLLFHGPPQEFISERYRDFFEEAKARSVIGNYGVSPRTIADLDQAIKLDFGTTFQWNFSVLEKRAVKLLEAYKTDKSYTFIGRSILYRGLLTEKFINAGTETKFHDARSQLNLDLVNWVYKNGLRLRQLAADLDLTISQLAIIYAVMNPALCIGLIGVRTFENLDSLERLMSMSQSKIQACYEVATNFTPLPSD